MLASKPSTSGALKVCYQPHHKRWFLPILLKDGDNRSEKKPDNTELDTRVKYLA